MKQSEYEHFLSLTSKCERDLQKEVDRFLVAAMTEAENGDLLIAGELVRDAAQIVASAVEYDNQCKRTANEMERFVASVDDLHLSRGGLLD